MKVVTCTAPVNIALVKYWGKRNVDLVLPTNSSVSITLSQEQLCAKTSVAASPDFAESRLWLNGREESLQTSRFQNLIKEIKRRAREEEPDAEESSVLKWGLHICSENNFPTAAGLASSAAGHACLAYTLAQLYGIKGDISDIARRGSGSACRSVYGGFVAWDKGEQADGTDSVARQTAPSDHWPQLRVLILVVSDQKKHVGSTEAMQTTVQTSQLMAERIRQVPKRVKVVERAILDRDFQTFAECTMKDSNQLHAVCLDAYPPIFYLTDTSRNIISLVHAYNKYKGQNKVAYTFDAGPNACLYLLEEEVPQVISLLHHFFFSDGVDCVTGLPYDSVDIDEDMLSTISVPVHEGALKYVIHTKPGPGPLVCDTDQCLLNEDGFPKTLIEVKKKRKIDCVS